MKRTDLVRAFALYAVGRVLMDIVRGQICENRCREILCDGLYGRTDETSPSVRTKYHDVTKSRQSCCTYHMLISKAMECYTLGDANCFRQSGARSESREIPINYREGALVTYARGQGHLKWNGSRHQHNVQHWGTV